MAKISKSLTELIGKTPLLELSNYEEKNDLKAKIVGKLEYFNPAGSVKDRIALGIATILFAFKSTTVGAIVLGVLILCAALEAFLGFCLGCWMYSLFPQNIANWLSR